MKPLKRPPYDTDCAFMPPTNPNPSVLGKADDGRRFLTYALGEINDRFNFQTKQQHHRFSLVFDTDAQSSLVG